MEVSTSRISKRSYFQMDHRIAMQETICKVSIAKFNQEFIELRHNCNSVWSEQKRPANFNHISKEFLEQMPYLKVLI